ncbi:glycosyltransferase family 4 protein [Agromyces aurantiacus]|uniref:D-inositol 3-phosphate glycosyltransferase n=1 Tax=Agromyces aurantiacus TaxID=165814 RepID=A0ABV9R6A6_9MICO|nr:glycosyltransferase family 4 protein [Agromyces aurantiacus]MBM7504174.1 glycosyltransferase involved in cell wall biosynthesis [Agromyces aurantiacus]
MAESSPRRIAIAYDCLYPVHHGGGERVYRRMAELFVERGSHVTYVTRADWPADAAPSAPFDLVGVWRGEIHDADGVRTTSSAVAFAFALFRHFVRHRGSYDLVVVAALPVLNVFAVRLALLGAPTRLVVDWLEVWPARKWRAYAGAVTGTVAWVLQALAARVGDVLTVNSGFTRERLRRHRPDADPIVLGLVDLVGEEPDASTAAPEHPVVLFVGRHIADKRLGALPPALAVAREELPGLRALVVGTGPETDAARAAAREAGVEEAMEFLGRVDEPTLRRLFRESSVLVNPSAREGFGLVVAEAAAAATPSVVVAGEDNAAAELVVDGVNGEVAAEVAPAVLAAAIVDVVHAGAPLRARTLEWFRRERNERGLRRSVDLILERAAASDARRAR